MLELLIRVFQRDEPVPCTHTQTCAEYNTGSRRLSRLTFTAKIPAGNKEYAQVGVR